MTNSHALYWVALQQALGVPNRHIHTLLHRFGSARQVFDATPAQLAECAGLTDRMRRAILAKPFAAARAVWDECRRQGVWLLTPDDPAYPDPFRALNDMPCVIYGKGTLPNSATRPFVSIVGTRKPTRYGEKATRRIATVAAAAGMVIVSGGALGIDAAAHQAALDVKGLTVAVLGCGLGTRYLPQNRPLRQAIAASGAVISEYPPGQPATRYSFPVRNRLIAALSLGTVVVEAGEKSGSLITADCALEQGKDVFAVPGGVLSPSYFGSNKLLQDGATPVFTGLDLVDAYRAAPYHFTFDLERARAMQDYWNQDSFSLEPPEEGQLKPAKTAKTAPPAPAKPAAQPAPAQKPANRPQKDLSEPAAMVYNTILDMHSALTDDLVAATGLAPAALMSALTGLELDGLIARDPTGRYVAI